MNIPIQTIRVVGGAVVVAAANGGNIQNAWDVLVDAWDGNIDQARRDVVDAANRKHVNPQGVLAQIGAPR